jgi:cytoskeleton protein RodZ
MNGEAIQESLLPEGPGRQLREARTALKLSRADVATALRLKPEIIAALEADNTGVLPAPIYVNGYLRNYARLVDIPVDPVLEAYAQLQVEAPAVVSEIVQPQDRGQSRRIVRWVGVLVFGAVLAGFVSWLQNQDLDWITDVSLNGSFTDGGGAITSEPVAEPAVPPVSVPEPVARPELPVEELPGSSPVPAIESPADTLAAPAPVQDKQADSEDTVTTAVQAESLHRLVLRLDEDCWMEITDANGRHLVYDLVRAGQTLDRRGTAPFEVFFGNAAAVHMEVDGQEYDFSRHIRGKLARFTVTTDDDA